MTIIEALSAWAGNCNNIEREVRCAIHHALEEATDDITSGDKLPSADEVVDQAVLYVNKKIDQYRDDLIEAIKRKGSANLAISATVLVSFKLD